MLNRGIVHYSSRKMHSVGRSTTEAEYIGGSEAAKKVIWLRRLVAEIEGKDCAGSAVPMLLGDNKSAIQLASGVSNTSKIKHIDIAYHHILDKVKKGTILIQWVPGERQLADGMTRALDRVKFEAN